MTCVHILYNIYNLEQATCTCSLHVYTCSCTCTTWFTFIRSAQRGQPIEEHVGTLLALERLLDGTFDCRTDVCIVKFKPAVARRGRGTVWAGRTTAIHKCAYMYMEKTTCTCRYKIQYTCMYTHTGDLSYYMCIIVKSRYMYSVHVYIVN